MGSAASPPPTLDAPTSLKPPASAAVLLTQEDLKRVAAHLAVEMVEPGMTLGLGTGSMAAHALDRLGDLLCGGALRGVAGVPTSLKTEAQAEHKAGVVACWRKEEIRYRGGEKSDGEREGAPPWLRFAGVVACWREEIRFSHTGELGRGEE